MNANGESTVLYLLAADALLALHVLVVAFIIFGLILIVAGGLAGWRWITNRWFRYAHLAAIVDLIAPQGRLALIDDP